MQTYTKSDIEKILLKLSALGPNNILLTGISFDSGLLGAAMYDKEKNEFNYYFNELRYNKVNVYIYDYNIPSIEFHKKLGLTKEGRLRQMAYSEGKYHDIIFYGMLKSEFNELYYNNV